MSATKLARAINRAAADHVKAAQGMHLGVVTQTNPMTLELATSNIVLHDDEFEMLAPHTFVVDDTALVVHLGESWLVIAGWNDGGSSGGGGGIQWRGVWQNDQEYAVNSLVRFGTSAYINVLAIVNEVGGGPEPPLDYHYGSEPADQASLFWLALANEFIGTIVNTTPLMLETVSYGGGSPGSYGLQYSMFVTTPGTFTFTLRDVNGIGIDTMLFVEDAVTGAVVGYDDDNGPGRLSLLTQALPAGRYIVRVTGYDNSEVGEVGLTVTSPDGAVGVPGVGGVHPNPDADAAHWELVAGGGAAGSVIRNGVGPPDPALGNVGDFYIDHANPLDPILYGPKT